MFCVLCIYTVHNCAAGILGLETKIQCSQQVLMYLDIMPGFNFNFVFITTYDIF